MDLVAGAKRTVVIMGHSTKAGESRLRREVALPLTGRGVVDRVITDLAVFDFVGTASPHMVLVEQQAAISVEELRAQTEAPFRQMH